jgi:hypothetical protein
MRATCPAKLSIGLNHDRQKHGLFLGLFNDALPNALLLNGRAAVNSKGSDKDSRWSIKTAFQNFP